MTDVPRISEAEWEVMKVVWDRAPVTSNDIIDVLGKSFQWDPRTIKTMLNRLLKKGALRYEHHGRSYLYRPAVAQSECVRAEGRRFLDRVFGGGATPLLAHFIDSAKLDAAEIGKLRELLNRKEG